jgi:hypothetical protein
MSRYVSREKDRWDQAIEDAKDTIAKCKRKIETMEGAIEIFEESRKAGKSCPGDETSSN